MHEGVYREWVKPEFGGNRLSPIIYEASEAEHVVIKGSEQVTNWELYQDTVWKCTISNKIFNGYNPFATPLTGDWIVAPYDTPVHLGDLYLNGSSCYEAFSLDEVLHPVIRKVSPYQTWG